MGHGKILAGIESADVEELARQCVEEDMTVRALERRALGPVPAAAAPGTVSRRGVAHDY